MKSTQEQFKFIEMRAGGASHNTIARKLNISTATCWSWEQKFKKELAELKQANMDALFEAFNMTKEARIGQLGATLETINKAIARADWHKVSPERLLDLKLKYIEALKDEYIAPREPIKIKDREGNALSPKAILLNELAGIVDRIRNGEITNAQAGREGQAIANLLKAMELLKDEGSDKDLTVTVNWVKTKEAIKEF